MLQTVSLFAAGVFAVWYLPAAKAAIVGNPGPRVPAILAGVVVALPVAMLASIGVLLVFLITRSSLQLVVWQLVIAGVICGIITQVITRSPKEPSRALQIASQLWSPVPVLLRIILAGTLAGLVLFAVDKVQRQGAG